MELIKKFVLTHKGLYFWLKEEEVLKECAFFSNVYQNHKVNNINNALKA